MRKRFPFGDLPAGGRQSRGVIAKLGKFGWITKVVEGKEIYYQITDKGEAAVDKLLSPLKNTGHWDGRWRLVLFDIPETKRDLRDRLRRALTDLGMGLLQASVWISPNDIRKEIDEIAKKLKIETNLKFFEVTRNSSLDKTIIEKSWNLPELEDNYRRFILDAERLLKSIDIDPNARYSAKKMIFEYALLLKKDPILPWEFRQKDELRRRAHQIYLKLRTFVV